MTKPAPISVEELQAIPLLQGLAPVQLRMLASLMQRESIAIGQVLLTMGELGERVYFLQSGTVRICIARPHLGPRGTALPLDERKAGKSVGKNRVEKESGEEKEGGEGEDEGEEGGGENPYLVLNLCGPGEVLGEMSALDGQGCSAGVVAIEPCRALWMNAQVFRTCADEMPALLRALLHQAHRRFRFSTRLHWAVTTLDVTGSLCACLLLLAERYGQVAERYGQERPDGDLYIPLKLQQGDLGDMIGASRARVNVRMGELKAQGYLAQTRSGFVTIHDREQLARLSGTDTG